MKREVVRGKEVKECEGGKTKLGDCWQQELTQVCFHYWTVMNKIIQQERMLCKNEMQKVEQEARQIGK